MVDGLRADSNNIVAFTQEHPPQCFPFFGLPPSVLSALCSMPLPQVCHSKLVCSVTFGFHVEHPDPLVIPLLHNLTTMGEQASLPNSLLYTGQSCSHCGSRHLLGRSSCLLWLGTQLVVIELYSFDPQNCFWGLLAKVTFQL